MPSIVVTTAGILCMLLCACNSGNSKETENDSASVLVTPEPGPGSIPVEKPAPLSGTAEKLTGIWLRMQKDGVVSTEGFQLKKNGDAASVNDSKVLYKSWQNIGNDTLVMGYKKIVDKKEILLDDTFHIKTLNDTLLSLKDGKATINFRRA